MRITRQVKTGQNVSYRHEYCYEGHPGWGFSFPCAKDGTLYPMEPAAKTNLEKCRSGYEGLTKILDQGIKKLVHNYYIPPAGICQCGRKIILSHFTNPCDCGLDYDSRGNILAAREFWGEETGESYSDILGI